MEGLQRLINLLSAHPWFLTLIEILINAVAQEIKRMHFTFRGKYLQERKISRIHDHRWVMTLHVLLSPSIGHKACQVLIGLCSVPFNEEGWKGTERRAETIPKCFTEMTTVLANVPILWNRKYGDWNQKYDSWGWYIPLYCLGERLELEVLKHKKVTGYI